MTMLLLLSLVAVVLIVRGAVDYVLGLDEERDEDD